MAPSQAASVIPGKILVPIDFSPSSHQALEAATELAEKFGSKLYLLHVVPEYPGYALPESVSQQSIISDGKQKAEEHFEVSMAGLKTKGVQATSHVEVGSDVAGSILDAIDRENADLVVLTTHGHSGWYPQVFGSVAEKLVKLATVPVFLLRSPKPESSAKVTYSGMMEWW
ncbi:universal stress protein [Occallatibacter riparius]|uniref:Universal stress protein n=1 Tax=Occallatibacter riparius TaxID=1002689 RepID=A0A9J7BK90_9BACT|nr:universal stress protein [Occallatibacter riparius]UWZ82194.1 universal stress protein [Occallatibacter riparius]